MCQFSSLYKLKPFCSFIARSMQCKSALEISNYLYYLSERSVTIQAQQKFKHAQSSVSKMISICVPYICLTFDGIIVHLFFLASSLQEEPDQAVSDLQPHVGWNQSHLPWRTVPGRHFQDHKSWCCWLLEEIFWRPVGFSSVSWCLFVMSLYVDVSWLYYTGKLSVSWWLKNTVSIPI